MTILFLRLSGFPFGDQERLENALPVSGLLLVRSWNRLLTQGKASSSQLRRNAGKNAALGEDRSSGSPVRQASFMNAAVDSNDIC